MKKSYSGLCFLLTGFLFGPSANAALSNGSVLSFTPIDVTVININLPEDGLGSWFAVPIPDGYVLTPLTSLNGIVLGTTQPADTWFGQPVGNIDEPWGFFGNTGAHQTLSDTNVLSASGDTATVDFDGWSIKWSGFPDVDMSTGALNGNADGIANITCESGSGCGNGASYILDYSATVPAGDPSGFGGVFYYLHLEGTVSAIPVPAALWLFASGLTGLAGVARYRERQ